MPNEIPYGYCHCGCGKKTKIAKENRKKIGWVKGQPVKFLLGHNGRLRKGGEVKHTEGYILQKVDNHPNGTQTGYIQRSHFVVEKILGKYLPKNCEVHHVNEIRDDDEPKNLVVCQDRAYHFLLHRRQRALKACGHANWRKCTYCKQYDDPENLYIYTNGKYERTYHNKCANEHNKKRKLEKQAI